MPMTLQLILDFPRDYEIKPLSSAPPVHPIEKLYHYPMELEEGDRAGLYARVEPKGRSPWTGFFALGFDSDQAVNAICSCPHPDSACVVAGGYAYIVTASDPELWFRLEQWPVTTLRVLVKQRLILFGGFTTITAIGVSGVSWTTDRLSWEGITLGEIRDNKLHGTGWDAMANREVPFAVDLDSGRHSGGARPR